MSYAVRSLPLATIQRRGCPHIPGGIITDFDLLRKIADISEKYGVKAIKLTSAGRFALVGVRPEELDEVGREKFMEELGLPVK